MDTTALSPQPIPGIDANTQTFDTIASDISYTRASMPFMVPRKEKE